MQIEGDKSCMMPAWSGDEPIVTVIATMMVQLQVAVHIVFDCKQFAVGMCINICWIAIYHENSRWPSLHDAVWWQWITSDSHNNNSTSRIHNAISTLRMGLANRHQVRAMQASFLPGRLVLSTTHVAVQPSTTADSNSCKLFTSSTAVATFAVTCCSQCESNCWCIQSPCGTQSHGSCRRVIVCQNWSQGVTAAAHMCSTQLLADSRCLMSHNWLHIPDCIL